MKKQLLTLFAIFTLTIGFSQTFTDNYITYEVIDNTNNYVRTLNYDTAGGTIVNIPATVVNGGITYQVTYVWGSSFANKGLTQVSLPLGLTDIGSSAFANNNLTTVTIPNSVINILASAFINNQLNSIFLGNSLTTIGSSAFRSNLLTQVDIPASVTTLSGEAFRDNQLSSVILTNSIGVLETGVFRDNQLSNFIIPEGITQIKFRAFRNNLLTDVTLPSSLTTIGDEAFMLNQLTSLDIVDTITSVGMDAFRDNQLTNLIIGSGINVVEDRAFLNNQLTSITIPDNVTLIRDEAFKDNQLSNLVLSNNIENIKDSAFKNNQLTTVIIPDGVLAIDDEAFYNNPLADIFSLSITPPTIVTGSNDTFSDNRSAIQLHIPVGTMGAYVTDPGALWTGFNPVTEFGAAQVGDTFVYDFITYEITSLTPNEVKAIDYDMTGGTVVDIPSTVPHNSESYNVISIGNQAFQGNGLTSVTISDSVTSIGVYAFFQNAILEVELPAALTNIELGVFENNALNSVVIPDGVTSIGVGAFKNNSLTSVIIPGSVTTISIQAFRDNPLSDVFSESLSPPSISTGGSNDSFNSNRSNIHLHIPAGTMGAYVTDPGALWTGFNPVTEDALSVDEFQLQHVVKIITNPESLTITSTNNLQLNSYTLYTITGAKIHTGASTEISTSTMSKGIYILALDFDQGMLIKKVMIN
ncbi:hypothetical protein DMZ43_06140 [Meridianimaribacter sp. CL38]|uniref:leucine-rich repeat domain-containing protein n=1 Tax=Meridianimaribacter sp. CL38 TaxID=2213021 RepID=UPI00103F296F|nr:leucine-rich repeat domain-containing protein [Meridianimaribacter sp. CL38]TBV26641.1 hypothetical protein DMZ43_06140 [Meridianimaribacter sp. CL38]